MRPDALNTATNSHAVTLSVLGDTSGLVGTTAADHLTNTSATGGTLWGLDSDDVMTGNSGNDTLIVLYEADQDNTIATSGTTPTPTDCLGNSVPSVTSNPLGNYNIAENRFFVSANNSLSCRGNTAAGPQPLVDNVTQMQIWYGVATPFPATNQRGTVATRYLRANQIGDMNNGHWDQVVSVRLCLVIQSRDPVLDAPAPFFNCEGVSTPTTDRRLYRAFTTTVVLLTRTVSWLQSNW